MAAGFSPVSARGISRWRSSLERLPRRLPRAIRWLPSLPNRPLIAALAVRLCHEAGIPEEAFQLLPGAGEVGEMITSDPRIAGVAFTGSTQTAQAINRGLAAREGPIATLIAETGGQNAMIVDSTALPEQVTRDVVSSAFQSAGQRCSALRVLYIQDDVYDEMLQMIAAGSRRCPSAIPNIWRPMSAR